MGGRHRGWHVVAVGFLAMVAGTPVGPAGFAIFLLPMSDDLGWGRDLLGGGVAAGTLAGALVAPWVGRMVDRHGARAMLTLGGLGLGASYIGLSLVPPSAPWLFYLAYGLGRLIDMAVILLGATVAVSAWFSEQRGRAIGLVLSGNPIGVLLLVPLVQLVILESGWRPAWLVLGLTSWLVLVPAAWLLVRSPADVTAEARPRRIRDAPIRCPPRVRRKSTGRPVRGCGNARCRPRTAIHASSAASAESSSGTTRSVFSLPSGTFSQVPCPGRSHRQSSSRSSSSPRRSPTSTQHC